MDKSPENKNQMPIVFYFQKLTNVLDLCFLKKIHYQRNCNCSYVFIKFILMLLNRLKISFFSTFYSPCNFKINSKDQLSNICPLKSYVQLYRKHGHHYANLDPLQLYNKKTEEFIRPTDLGISFNEQLSKFNRTSSPLIRMSKKILDLEPLLKRVYQNTTGVEFSHIYTIQQQDWLYQNYQSCMIQPISSDLQIKFATTLIKAQALDHFLHKKFVTFKRYSGEGAQTTVLALDVLIQMAAKKGYKDIVLGMPHRGRLNTLVNVLNYPASHLLRKISGKTNTPPQLRTAIDDVTSHITQSTTKKYGQHQTKVTMVHNPSHLQAQNPVSMGKTRSKQLFSSIAQVLNIQVHGDAAITGQGIVYQSLCLGKVPKYDIGGSIHIITNNQIGYTTKPIDSRPSKYSSDIAKAFDMPIIHVNSNNVEDVYRVMKLALEYKTIFKKDILVDLICYRKYGHNQVDEPEFTQPLMYKRIKKEHIPATLTYSKFLQKQGIISGLYQSTMKDMNEMLEKQFAVSTKIQKLSLQDYMSPESPGNKAFTHQWKGFKASQYGEEYKTGFDTSMLTQFLNASVFYPTSFTIHPRIQKYHVLQRIKSIQSNQLNWASCEALALFSLNFQGYNIRLTGQDVERGTFSQRHLNLIDQKTENQFNSLNFFSEQSPGRGKVEIYNSPLTENAAMSYQYGYSIDHPNNMTIWQAQFGDFFNTAQVFIDTYLTNSQNKWLRQSGLTIILPHGYDGGGPEHSSCRIQRFLQLANSDGSVESNQYKKYDQNAKKIPMKEKSYFESIQQANFSFVVPTKPSNMFHVLRRQMKRNFRKPLIVAGPKTLLRHPRCMSKIQDMGPGSQFKKIIIYQNQNNLAECEVVMFCSGKFVYDISSIIQDKKATKTVLVSIEELFPFPQQQIQQLLTKCSKNTQIIWVQQENLNSGAFTFIQPRINRIINNLNIKTHIQYVGRKAIAACAVGSSDLHKSQTIELTNWIQQMIK